MKIAFILPKIVNRGPVLVVRDLISQIKDKVSLIDVYYFDDGNEIEFPCNCYKISFRAKFDFDKYDIIHSHMLRPDLYVWLNKKRIMKAKCISTLHQDIIPSLTVDYNWVTAIVFEKIWLTVLKSQDAIVTLTKTMLQQYRRKLSQVDLFAVYSGRSLNNETYQEVDLEDQYEILNLKSKYKIIGVSARLTKIKGISQLIKVLMPLKDYALVMVGDGKEMSNLIKLSKELQVHERCLFLGYRIDGYRYLKYFDIYAMSSYSEGFGLGVLEAAHYKLPTVCSNLPIFKELFSNDEVSFFELNNISSLESAIVHLEKNSVLFSRNIFEKVSGDYSVEKMAENYLHLYNKITCKV